MRTDQNARSFRRSGHALGPIDCELPGLVAMSAAFGSGSVHRWRATTTLDYGFRPSAVVSLSVVAIRFGGTRLEKQNRLERGTGEVTRYLRLDSKALD